jgi:hypothetical protein
MTSRQDKYQREVNKLMDDPRLMARRVAQNASRIRAQRWGLLFLALAYPLLSWVVVIVGDHSEDAREQEELDVNYVGCLRGNELRALMIEQTELAYSGGGLDLTKVPGFDDLDQATQQFFHTLADVSRNRPNRSMVIVEAIRSQIRDCEAEYPDHSAGARLTHRTTTSTQP